MSPTAAHRRRVLLAALLGAVVVSFVVAFVAREGRIWGVQAAVDTVLVAYLAVLLHARNAAAEQEMARRGLRA